MKKITVLEFSGKNKKGGLLQACIDYAIAEKKSVHRGLGGGLDLMVNRGSGKACFYYKNKKIGDVAKMTLAEAFKIAGELKENEQTEKKERRQRQEHSERHPTLKTFFQKWYEEKILTFKPSSGRGANLKALFNLTLYPLHNFKLDEITPYLVYQKIASIHQTPGNKHNAIQMLSQMLTNAMLKGLIPGNPIAGMLVGSESPFKAPKALGRKWIRAEDLGAKFFEPLKDTALINRCFYLLLALTGLRFNECRLLRWDWINLKEGMIEIPGDAQGANKTQRPLLKPLTTQMKSVLMILMVNFGSTSYVFKADHRDTAIAEALLREPWKALTSRECEFHGIRKSMKTWLIAKGGQNEFISELALTHDVRSDLQKTYDKNDYVEDVRKALQLWNDFLAENLPQEFQSLLQATVNVQA